MSHDPLPKTTVEAAIRIADAVVNAAFYPGRKIGRVPPDYRPNEITEGQALAFRALQGRPWRHQTKRRK